LEEALVAALPSGHPLAAHKRLGLTMLANEPFVLPARSRGPGFHDQILAMCRTAGFSPRVVQEGSQTDAISLVASGAGVAIVPTSLRVIRRAGVVYRPLRERPVTQLVMVWRKGAPSPVLHAFLDTVRRLGRLGSDRGQGDRGHSDLLVPAVVPTLLAGLRRRLTAAPDDGVAAGPGAGRHRHFSTSRSPGAERGGTRRKHPGKPAQLLTGLSAGYNKRVLAYIIVAFHGEVLHAHKSMLSIE
jgi:LysR substrate binding domain